MPYMYAIVQQLQVNLLVVVCAREKKSKITYREYYS